MKNRLLDQIKNAPASPGVYQFMDMSGDVLYVGKAKSIRSRIKSYFRKEINRGPAIDLMVSEAIELKFICTDSEIEAVILEAELIKQLQPKYNIRLKDDKSFLVIKIFKGGTPCLSLVRYKNVDFNERGVLFFGPYPSGELLKKSLKYLRKIFPYKDCSQSKQRTYIKKNRACIYGDLGICPAPCVSLEGADSCRKNMRMLIQFLRGKKQMVYNQLVKEMVKLSKIRQYEEAAIIRNKLNALDHLKEIRIGLRDDFHNGAGTMFKRIECFDISNILGQFGVGGMAVFINGEKSITDYRKFKIRFVNQANDLEMLREMLYRRFKNDWPKPDLLLIDGGQNHLRVGAEVLKSFELKIPIVSIAKGPKRDKNEFFFGDDKVAKIVSGNKHLKNILISCRDESHRFAIGYYRQLHQKGMINA